tara:strand:- start:3237 stop:3992 length:756 start_codon:yes stop_codon:yes gene_type:complete
MEFKELYSFPLEREEEVEKETSRKDKKTGDIIKKIKKVKEKIPYAIRLKRPSRRELEEAELEYSVEMSKCVKKGILTRAMLFKKYSDTGGMYTDDESRDYGEIYRKLLTLQNEYVRMDSIDKPTDSQKEKLEKIKDDLAESKKKLVELESNMHSLFDHTADTKAQNKLLLWYTLMLTHIQGESDEAPVPYFKGDTFEEKTKDYYDKEDDSDEFYQEIVKKVTTILAFWFFNQASKPEEFNNLIEQMEKGEL